MAPEPKISDADLRRLRRLAADGWTTSALAEAFGITQQHVGRLVRGEQRPALPVDAITDGVDVSGAVGAYLAAADLEGADGVLAAVARTLAAKLDAVSKSDAATAANAAPRIASALVDVLGELRDGVPREPDGIDRIAARRAARLAIVEAQSSNGSQP